ncbi:MAG: sodium:proton antiporter NhaD [Candidatus Aquicultor sp.]|nr:sodium:proton antiporter NhaD [Candidatus Aquicultor sp.]
MALTITILFIIAYILISAEHKLQVSKSAVAMFFAGLLWILIAIDSGQLVEAHLSEAGTEIFEIIVFLLCAMTLVEILVHYKFFELVRVWLVAKELDNTKQLWTISILAFALSAVIDNLTTTIILTQLSRLFFKGKNILVAAALVIVAANAGGAFSPIGDVTTTMLWLKGKFSSGEVIMYGFLPSLTIYLIAAPLLIRQAEAGDRCVPEVEEFKLVRSEKLVIAFVFGSFTLPFIFHAFHLKPYMGLVTGLGLTWLVVDALKRGLPNHRSHFTASIENLLQKTDISSLKFFIGILLAVAALNHLGILEMVSNSLFGDAPSLGRYVLGSSVMGVLSAIVDNVPLTAAATDIVKTTDPIIWVLIALAVGTGGSILVIGSAAGVVAMGIVKELNFVNYLKIASLPALLGYLGGIGVWYVQYLLLF